VLRRETIKTEQGHRCQKTINQRLVFLRPGGLRCTVGKFAGRDPCRRDVLRRGQPVVRIAQLGKLHHLLVAGNLAQGRGVRHARPDGVGRSTVRGELHGELADVRFERGLGGGDRAVGRPHAGAAGARHGEDARALAEQLAAEQVLNPVDEAVGHDVQRHLHLILGQLIFRVRGQVGFQRAEGQRVHQHGDRRAPELRLDLVQHLLPLERIRRVDVEEKRLDPGILDGLDELFHPGHRTPAVQMDADDMHALPRELLRRGRPEAAGRAEDQRPLALQALCRHAVLLK